MHDTAMEYGHKFFEAYAHEAKGLKIVDVGAQDICGSLRSVVPPGNTYIGLDFVEGKGVDVVIQDPYALPFEDDSIDICVSSSCFEHAEFFWLSFNEALRVLKPHGLLYLNVPSNGPFHRYPADCWRFYPDSGIALQNWGRRSGYRVVMLESFVGIQKRDVWNDFVAVFLKDSDYLARHAARILDGDHDVLNGRIHGKEELINPCSPSQDQNAHKNLKEIITSINHIMNS
jgi:SAM-dependent methyltransferase